ncbi:MAG: hypothetical protein ACK4M1_11150 [Flavobacterium sp.]
MNYNNLKIPESQKDNFKFFLNLPDAVRNELVEIIQQAPMGLSNSSLFDHISSNIKNLSNEKIGKLLSIYENLSDAKDDLGYSDDEFIEDLSNALIDTQDPDLEPNDKSILVFKELFSSNTNINASRKIHNELLENEKNYDSSRISTDIRPVFDKDQFIGSTIVNKLKIAYFENDEEKSIFFSLDDKDLVELIEELKKAQEQNYYIKENFNNLKFIDISR